MARTEDPRTVQTLIRPAIESDVDVLHRFIVELAEVEDFPGAVTAQPEDVAAALFGTDPVAEAAIAIVDGEPAGFALFYPTYSTVLGRPGIHLEDLYVAEEHRGGGLGRGLVDGRPAALPRLEHATFARFPPGDRSLRGREVLDDSVTHVNAARDLHVGHLPAKPARERISAAAAMSRSVRCWASAASACARFFTMS